MHYDFTLYQGSDLELTVVLKDSEGVTRDLTGYSFRGEAKRSLYQEEADLVFSFESTDLANGQFKLRVPAYTSTSVPLRQKTKLFYDVEMYTDDKIERILMGKIEFDPEVTR